MSLATILPRSSVRVFVHSHLAARRRTGFDWRGEIQSSRHRVAPLRRMSSPISIVVGVPVPILSAVGLGSVGTSPRAVRMSGPSVTVPRSDFTMLQKQMGKDR